MPHQRLTTVLSVRYCVPASIGWGVMHWWPLSVCLSVCLSVPSLTLSREWKSVGSWKLAGKKPATCVTHDPIYRSIGQRSRSRMARKSAISSEWEGLQTSNLVYGWSIRWPASSTCTLTSNLKALGGCSGQHLQERAYWGGPATTGCRACF